MRRIDVTMQQLAAWRTAPHAIARADVVLSVEGPGAVACVQGIFTNDLERAGHPTLLWGAVLTPKGMIITDLWAWRREASVWLIVPEAGAAPLLELLRKSFPPRLARVTDLRATHAVWWLTGGPAPTPSAFDSIEPHGPAPFSALAVLPPATGPAILAAAGWQAAPGVAADALAVMIGWPMLGHEIDERTLVQEVRFDELQGVRYDKGCYVGQETVSRLHFRGHPNRELRAVVGRGAVPTDSTVTGGPDDKEVGTVASLLVSGGHWLATVRLRREVHVGDRAAVGGHDGRVQDFPVAFDSPA
jgi:folate-binding protein YgfZ